MIDGHRLCQTKSALFRNWRASGRHRTRRPAIWCLKLRCSAIRIHRPSLDENNSVPRQPAQCRYMQATPGRGSGHRSFYTGPRIRPHDLRELLPGRQGPVDYAEGSRLNRRPAGGFKLARIWAVPLSVTCKTPNSKSFSYGPLQVVVIGIVRNGISVITLLLQHTKASSRLPSARHRGSKRVK